MKILHSVIPNALRALQPQHIVKLVNLRLHWRKAAVANIDLSDPRAQRENRPAILYQLLTTHRVGIHLLGLFSLLFSIENLLLEVQSGLSDSTTVAEAREILRGEAGQGVNHAILWRHILS